MMQLMMLSAMMTRRKRRLCHKYCCRRHFSLFCLNLGYQFSSNCSFSTYSDSEQIVNQVLDELGVGFGEQMASVPVGKAKATESMDADADLQVLLLMITFINYWLNYI